MQRILHVDLQLVSKYICVTCICKTRIQTFARGMTHSKTLFTMHGIAIEKVAVAFD